MKYKYLIITLLLFYSVNNQSQKLEELKTIYSKVLNEKRDIKVLLPNNYSIENKYPVIYITDANYNFEIAFNYLTQLIKSNSIPKTILVGIPQKNRGNELDVFWSEHGIKFKNFVFTEVITFIDKKYSTSGFNTIVGHSDGAEFNHLLMIEKNNPFRGFINVSENLNTDVSNEISKFFKTYTGDRLYYFIASAKYDSPDRITAGKIIDKKYSESKNTNILFQNKLYRADHQNVLSKSLIDGILFIFQDYRNLDSYKNFKDYTENYKNNIEKHYRFKPEENENDIDYFFGNILDNKDIGMYEYIIEYAASNNIFEILPYDRAWQYFYMDEHLKSIEYWNKSIEDNNETSPRIFYYNFKKAIDSYLILNNPKQAIAFLEKCKLVFPQYELSFNYFIAKTALENSIEKRKGKKYIKYCEQNYKENEYFKIEDLHKLKEK
jgi:predicted alpha/beta superfamily hydrolase